MSKKLQPINAKDTGPEAQEGMVRASSFTVADHMIEAGYNSPEAVLRSCIAERTPALSFAATAGMDRKQLISLFEKHAENDPKTRHFTSSGDILISDLTNQMITVIQEDYNQNIFRDTYLDNMFPDLGVIAESINFDIVAAPGGAMDPYVYGASVRQKKRLGNRTATYKGAVYRNSIFFDEAEITFMRQLGQQPYDMRGILQRLSYNILKLKTLIYNRKQLLKATIFDGSVTIDPPSGAQYTVDYQIPSWNLVTNITAQTWGTYVESTGALTLNPLADPIFDITYYLNAYQPWFTRRGRLNKARLVMNPITMMMITQNPTVRAQLVALQTAGGSPVAPQGQYTVDNIIKSLVPGFNGEVIIEDAGFLLEDSDASWDTNGFLSTAPAQAYFVPTGKVFFDVNPLDYPLGNLMMQPSIQKGGMGNAMPGEWIIAQPLIGEGFPEGLERPVLKAVGGFAGGLAPVHVEDVFIGTFGTLTP